MKKGCGGAGSSALHVVVNDGPGSCAWQLMNQGSFGGSFGGRSGVVRLYFQHLFSFVFFVCSFFYLLLFLSHRLLLLLFSLFPSCTQSYSFSNQTIVAEWLFVMQSSAGRRVVCSARGGLSRVCYNGTLYPSNEGNPLVFWWIAVTLLWPGRGDFSASGLSTFKKIALTSALDCRSYFIAWWGISSDQLEPPYFEAKWSKIHPAWGISNSWMVWCLCHGKSHHLLDGWYLGVPSGKRLHSYGKSLFFMAKSTISMAIFHSKLVNVYQRVPP